MCNSVKQKSSHLDLKLGEKKKKGESIDWFLTKPADNIQARLRSDCQDSCKIAKLGAFSLAPRSIAWHLFGSTEQPGYTPWNVQGWGSWCCWKPPWTVHPSVTVSHSCASFWCQDKWHKFIYFYSINSESQNGGTRSGFMLCPEQNIYTNTVQSFRMLPDGDYGNFKGKKYKYHFASGMRTLKFSFGRETDLIWLKYST